MFVDVNPVLERQALFARAGVDPNGRIEKFNRKNCPAKAYWEAQRGINITEADADALIAAAQQIIALLGG